MLGSNAILLWRSLLAAKRGNFREIPDILRMSRKSVLSGAFPANRWLEYQYGWKPLVSDCYDIYNKLQSVVERPLYIYGNTWSPVTNDRDYNSGSFKVIQKEEGGVRVKLCASIRNSFARDMNSWGLINPLSIAWELVPFSFVVDWGIPIGNTLSSLTATAGLDFVWGFESTLKKSRWNLSYNLDPVTGYVVEAPGSYSWRRTRFDRRTLKGFPLPDIYGEDGPFSTTRIANAIALAKQLFTGRR
nr:MAG: maturation protein [Hangzhou fiers-like virus 1]